MANLVLGKHSGRAAFREKLHEQGLPLEGDAFNDAFRRFKDMADDKKVVFDDDIIRDIEIKKLVERPDPRSPGGKARFPEPWC